MNIKMYITDLQDDDFEIAIKVNNCNFAKKFFVRMR